VASTAALPAATRLASASPNALTIATWNLEWLAESDGDGPIARDAAAFTRLGKYAARLNADVIAVQEVASVAALARVFDPTRYAFHVTADSTPQRTGFVYDKRLVVRIHPDYTELNTGSLRSGADLAVYWNGKWVRLLSVHLKSGCFAQPMTHGDACTKLKAQIPRLEAWVDARANEQTPFAVLGDFNRRLFAANDDSVWRALDDNQPPESDLFSPTQGERSGCWKSQHAKYIDHIVLSRSLTAHFSPGSFAQQLYDASDAPYRKQLSDHCPIALRLSTQLPPLPPLPPAATAHATTSPVTSSALPSAPVLTLVKGNRTRKGKLYYHTIDCPQYTRVKVDDTKGEQTFADEVSARAAGYLRSPDCPKR
jgi:endonuclease/exonuclease/phosphatase family metal-dependent hydrolase